MKAVLFDVGQTLIDGRRGNDETFVSILNELGVTFPPDTDFNSAIRRTHDEFNARGNFTLTYRGADLLEFWRPFDRRVIELAGVKGDLDAYATQIHLRWFDHVGIYAYDDVNPSLSKLYSNGMRLGIISNGFEEEIHDILKRASIDSSLFNPIVGLDTFSCEKPNPKVFEETARLAGLSPNECAFVGDKLDRDGGSAKAGMHFFWLDRKKVGGCPEWATRITTLRELERHL